VGLCRRVFRDWTISVREFTVPGKIKKEERSLKMKGSKFSGVLTLFVGMMVSLASAAQVNMQEGKWEVTTKTKMEGLPFPIPVTPVTVTECLTKEDLVPKAGNKDKHCDVTDQNITGNKVTWKVKCANARGSSEGTGEIIYSGDSYTGKMKTKMTDNKSKQAMTSTITMKGKRIGPCSK
jgi:hypothetical protein